MSSNFIKGLIKQKINNLSASELISYAEQYGFSISASEADSIISYIKNRQPDPFSAEARMEMVRELTRITDAQTAKKALGLFNQLVQSYGLGHLFY